MMRGWYGSLQDVWLDTWRVEGRKEITDPAGCSAGWSLQKNKKTKNDFKNFQVISDQNILEITSIFLAKTVEFVVNISGIKANIWKARLPRVKVFKLHIARMCLLVCKRGLIIWLKTRAFLRIFSWGWLEGSLFKPFRISLFHKKQFGTITLQPNTASHYLVVSPIR